MTNEELHEVRTDIRELRADNKKLGEKIDWVYTTLRDKIDQSHAALMAAHHTLREKMEAGFAALEARLNARIDAVDDKLTRRMDSLEHKLESVTSELTHLSNDVASMRGLQKATLWVLGIVGSLLAVLVTAVAKAIHWF